MALWILRSCFLVVAVGVAFGIVTSDINLSSPSVVVWGIIAAALALIAVDTLIPHKRIEVISCVYFGIIVGLFFTFMISTAVEPLLYNAEWEVETMRRYRGATQVVIGIGLCYLCISLLLQTREDFRFIIPYVEFSKEVKGSKPYVLDTSVIIDGRIADVVDTGILDNELLIPRFVLGEIQGIADSNDKMRRSRGRRGLDILNRLRNDSAVDLRIYDRQHAEMAGQPVDMKLILLAKELDGKVVTGDYNLNKVAKIHNVQVINLNDIANSLKPVFLPGEKLDVRIVKAGEEAGQGVGYLDDGTMIVVEGGRDHIGQSVSIAVTSVLQTSAGRMIFGKYERMAK